MSSSESFQVEREPDSHSRQAIVVLGMHRSGTSAVAGCLHRLGVDFGPRLMPPTAANARGFYEHIDIVNLHDRLLLAAGSSWHNTDPRAADWLSGLDTARFQADLAELLQRDFSSAPLWGIKDPRLCRLLPWWEPRWAEMQTQPLFVIVLRDPREVAASLQRRDGFSMAKGYLLWLLHTLEAERATRSSKRVFLDFAEFLTDWREAVAPVRGLIGRPWPIPPEEGATTQEPFVDPAMALMNGVTAGGELPLWVEEVDAALRREPKGKTELFVVLDRVRSELAVAQALYGTAHEQQSDLVCELQALQQQTRWYEAEWQKAKGRLRAARDRLEKRS